MAWPSWVWDAASTTTDGCCTGGRGEGRTDVQLGFAVPLAGSWATPDNQVELGCRAEELGYASLWTFQRLLFPADPEASETPKRWSPVYRSVHDPLVTLAFLAAHTSRVRLGVAVRQHAVVLAAAAGQAGDDPRHGVPRPARPGHRPGLGPRGVRRGRCALRPARRPGRRVHRGTADDLDPGASSRCDGEFHQIPASVVEPKPVQRPHPPLLLGGSADAALRRAGRLCDGWVSSSGQDLHVDRDLDRGRGRRRPRGRPGPLDAALRLSRCGAGAPGGCGEAAPADRLVRRDPRRPRDAGRAGRHRGLPRPQLRPGGRQRSMPTRPSRCAAATRCSRRWRHERDGPGRPPGRGDRPGPGRLLPGERPARGRPARRRRLGDQPPGRRRRGGVRGRAGRRRGDGRLGAHRDRCTRR